MIMEDTDPVTGVQGLKLDDVDGQQRQKDDGGLSSISHSNCGDDNEVLDFVDCRKRLEVIVRRPKPGLSTKKITEVDCYILPAIGTKGLILILNIVDFDDPQLRSRLGSDWDVDNVSELFRHIDFKPFPEGKMQREERRKTKQDIQDLIQSFKTRCNEEKPASIFVYIGSHGQHPNQIFTSDSKKLDLHQDIVHQFSHEKCPVLKGKPKVFIVQSCQDFTDRTETDHGATLRKPIIEDVLICYSGMPGEPSMRDIFKGSWFTYCLVLTMMEEVMQMTSFKDILKMTREKMRNIQAFNGIEQVSVATSYGFKKDLYFFGTRSGLPTVKKFCRAPQGLKEFINGSSKYAIVSTLDTQLTCDKIRENLEGCRFLSWEEFAVSVSTSNQCVNENESGVQIVKNCSIKDLNELSEPQLEHVSKVVLVTSEMEQNAKDFVWKHPCWNSGAQICTDNVEWKDLTVALKLEISKKLKEQFKVEFGDVELKGQILIDLINKKEVEVFVNSIPEQISYYVERKLQKRDLISYKILEDEDSTDIVLVQGIERFKLSRLMENDKVTGSSGKFLRGERDAKVLVLDRPNHFHKICAKTTSNVHWIEYDEGRLRWIRSRGDLGAIQECIYSEENEVVLEAGLIRPTSSNQPVCIAGSPGMGKTTLLKQIGRKLLERYPERQVVFIRAPEFIQSVKDVGLLDRLKSIEKVLVEKMCANVIGEVVLKSKFCSSDDVTIELMLDAFDKVDSQDSELAHEILKVIGIGSSFQCIRLWLTSRPHFLKELENTLNVLGYNLQPFSEDDQVQFFISFWSRDKPLLDIVKLKCCAEELLHWLRETLDEIYFENEMSCTRIPLLCYMVGDVAVDIIEANDDDGNPLSSFPVQLDIDSIKKVFGNIFGIFGNSRGKGDKGNGLFSKLFHYFIGNKLGRYLTSKKITENMSEGKLKSMHAGLAMAELFPCFFPKMLNLFTPLDIDQCLKIGLLETSSATTEFPKFIHPTIAEFLVAWFLTDSLTKEDGGWTEDLTDFLFEFALLPQPCFYVSPGVPPEYAWVFPENLRRPRIRTTYEINYPVLGNFINVHMSDVNFQLVPEHVRASLTRKAVGLKNYVLAIAHACIHSKSVHTFKFFLEMGIFDLIHKLVFSKDCLLLAVSHSPLELIKLIFHRLDEEAVSNKSFQITALQYACSRGDYSVVEYLIREKGFGNRLAEQEELSEGAKSLMFKPISNSNYDSAGLIEEKIQVLQMLFQINPKLLEALSPKLEETPLLMGTRDYFAAHVRLLTQLVELGADVLVRSKGNETIIHLSPLRSHLSSEDYHSLLMSIPEEKLRELVKVKNENGEMPLETYMKFMKSPATETLTRFQQVGADFGCVLEYRTVLDNQRKNDK